VIARYLRWAQALTKEDLAWLDSFLDLLGGHDKISLTHSCAVAVIAFWFARKRGHSLEMQAQAFMAGALHDVGKLKVPRYILRASKIEWNLKRKIYWPVVRDHVWHGYNILRQESNRFARLCALVALFHHQDQRKGYPNIFLLLYHGIIRPWSRDFQRILFYVLAADQIAASTRDDQDQHLKCGVEVVSESLDIYTDVTHSVRREELMHRLLARAPRVKHLIRQAFQEGISL
jgi:hypothetical protein